MYKNILLLFWGLVFIVSPCNAQAVKTTPEAFVEHFYDWYLHTDLLKKNANDLQHFRSTLSSELYAHLEDITLNSTVDYFVKFNLYGVTSDKYFVVTKNHIVMTNKIVAVPTSIAVDSSSQALPFAVVVFLRNTDEGWQIVKVTDAETYLGWDKSF